MLTKTTSYGVQPVSESSTSEQGLQEIVRFLRRRWMYIIGTAAIVALLATLLVMQATPKYTAESSVAVESGKNQVVSFGDAIAGVTPDESVMATQAAIVKSPKLFLQLAKQMNLENDPEFSAEARAKATSGFSLFKPSTWFGDAQQVTKKPTSRDLAETRAALIASVTRAFAISPEPKSYIISISATSTNPMKATAMANVLADLYIRDGIATKYDASRRAAAYLQDRVNELRGSALASDRAAAMYKASAGLSGSTEGNTVDTQQLGELNSQLIIARSDRAAKEAQLSQIRNLSSGDGGVEAAGIILQSPLIQRLREQESEVLRKLAELQATYGQNHPRIINANAELRDLRSKIRDEVGKVAASTANDVAISRAREHALAGSLSGIEGRVNQGGAAQVRLRELEREADANKSVYEVFLNKLKENNQQADVQTADARIVAPAIIPLQASSPRVGATIGAAILAGLLLGALLSLVLEKLDNTVRGADMLETMGGGATLAFLPTVSGYERPEDAIVERPQAIAAEALRTLRSSLALSDVDNPPKVVMLSSSVPAEGKTFVSAGLARVSAQAGVSTILIDGDMRHPRVHSAIGIENGPGLVQVLSGSISLEDALQKDPLSDLMVLTAGHGSINPPDLLRSDQMQHLMAHLRATYGMVVLDTPPFVPMTDSQILASMVDKMILVVRWGSTPVPVIQNVIKQIRRVDAPLVGSVLSRVHLSRQAGYGFGDYGYHYTRYGAYYGTDS